jgi:hypothetical protein
MTAFQTLSGRTLDDIETDILSLHQRITATEYEFLCALREYDLRQGWKEYGFNNCAEWLNFKCAIETNTAREKLRVAHALWCLPLASARYREGTLSYSKARSITRVATPENEQELIDYALRATAEQVQNHCKALRYADRKASTEDVNRVHKQRYLSRTRNGDGSMTISVELTEEAGELVMKAIELAAGGLEQARAAGNDSFHSRQADALVEVAKAFLAGGSGKTTSTADHYQVMVHVDETALREVADQANKSDLPLESIRRLCCDGSLVPVSEDKKGNPLDVGRKHRTVSPALRRALLSRDKCCRFPGCTHDKWVDAHHVTHWIDGGETSLENTMLLCTSHHRLLHEGGFSIEKNFEGDWYFLNARGKTIPDAPVYTPTEIPDNWWEAHASRDACAAGSMPAAGSDASVSRTVTQPLCPG